MICLTTTLQSPRPHLPLNPRKTPFLTNPTITTPSHPCLNPLKPKKRRECRKSGLCRAEFSHDAPFAAAIGACILTSLLFPLGKVRDDESQGALDTTDARFAVMGIISFIPYFNWLSWVFAWLDTGNRRYAVYAVVYLAPYLRYNFSLSPEESWLPIASIIFGIIHVQLEASIEMEIFRACNCSVKLQSISALFGFEVSKGKEKKTNSRQKNPSLIISTFPLFSIHTKHTIQADISEERCLL